MRFDSCYGYCLQLKLSLWCDRNWPIGDRMWSFQSSWLSSTRLSSQETHHNLLVKVAPLGFRRGQTTTRWWRWTMPQNECQWVQHHLLPSCITTDHTYLWHSWHLAWNPAADCSQKSSTTWGMSTILLYQQVAGCWKTQGTKDVTTTARVTRKSTCGSDDLRESAFIACPFTRYTVLRWQENSQL